MQSSDLPPDPAASDTHEITTELGSVEARRKFQIIQTLIEPCDRATYGKRLEFAAKTLECSVRTVQRLVKKCEKEGLAAFADDGRSDKGKHRISEEWQKFIVNEYRDGKRTAAQVAVKVKREAQVKGLKNYPSHMTVYRVLAPLIERKQQSSNIRNIGWQGSRLSLKTRAGEEITVEYSNQVWRSALLSLRLKL